MKLNKKKWVVIIILLFIVIGSLVLINYLNQVNNYQSAVENLTYANIDLSKIPDGEYIGECNVQFIYAKVRVTVHSGKIRKIDILKHKNERGAPAESITDKIIQEQKIDVEAISGATNSSKVIKKAVENALTKLKAA